MSKIKVVLLQDESESFELNAGCLKEVLSLLQLHKSVEFVSELVKKDYKYLLLNGDDYENMVSLTPEVATSSFDGFDTLVIVPDLEIEGEEPFTIAAVMILGTEASTAAVLVTAAALAIAASIAVSFALSAVMSALSPTPETGKNLNSVQNKLFNSAPIVRNQGGSVPLIFGNPYCGAVLISSGISTEEVTV